MNETGDQKIKISGSSLRYVVVFIAFNLPNFPFLGQTVFYRLENGTKNQIKLPNEWTEKTEAYFPGISSCH